MAGPHCLVFEPDVTGHRLQHVRHLADALLDIGCRVTLALQSDCRDHAEYRVHVSSLEPRVEMFARLDPRQHVGFFARRQRIGELLNTIAALEPDWVYVPYADGTTQIAALESLLRGSGVFRRVPIEAQIMRGRYAYPLDNSRQALGLAANRFLTRHSPWRVTHVLDPFALQTLEPPTGPTSFRLIPEPVESLPAIDRRAARTTLGIPEDGRYLSFVGGLHSHKGIDRLVASFARANVAANDRLLFVGKTSPPIHDLLYRDYDTSVRQGRIVVIDRYVSDHELDCGFLAADVIAVTHPRQIGSSGTLVRGAASGRYVLASDFGWVGWATRTFQLGDTVDVGDLDQYAAAIATAFELSTSFAPATAAARFCKYHTVSNQKAHWVAEIAETLGLPSGPQGERIDWSWVMEAVDAGQ